MKRILRVVMVALVLGGISLGCGGGSGGAAKPNTDPIEGFTSPPGDINPNVKPKKK